MSISADVLVAASLMGFAIAFIGCVVGLFADQYRDNWAQHLGMIGVGFASALKIQQIYDRGFASPETALLAVGLALFGIGVGWKVWRHNCGHRLSHESHQRPKPARRKPRAG